MVECTACPLHETARKLVWGEGPTPCDWMLIGEGPGDKEDRKGRPFIGMSGARLQALLSLAGLSRAQVYITNIVKHRPPKNRNPKVSEIKACRPHLEVELAAVRPKVIITMGLIAAKQFDPSVQLRKDHGVPRTLPECADEAPHSRADCDGTCGWRSKVVLVPMYHPAFSLRNPSIWPLLVDDFTALRNRLTPHDDTPPSYGIGEGLIDNVLDSNVEEVGFDYETTSPRAGRRFLVHEAVPVGYSYSTRSHEASYYPVDPPAWLFDRTLVVHNAKFEYWMSRKLGYTMDRFEDTKLAAYLLGHHSTHLKHLTKQLLGVDPITYEQVTHGRDMSEVPVEEIAPYAAADADHTLRLWNLLGPDLDRLGLRKLYEEVEKPLIPIIVDMQERGVLVDQPQAKAAQAYFGVLSTRALAKAYKTGAVPRSVNLRSRSELAQWLKAEGAPITEKTDVNKWPKTDRTALLEARDAGWHPELMTQIIEFYDMQKLASFPKGFLEQMDKGGVLHPEINQAGHTEEASDDSRESPLTGRVSTNYPNVQQIPHHGMGTTRGSQYEINASRIRKAIRARPGYTFLAGDFAQQEPRVAAITCPEPLFIEAFERGEAVYGPFGEGIYQAPVDKRSDPGRWDVAKKSMLSFIWGNGGAGPWSERLTIMDPSLTVSQGRRAYGRLDRKYRGIRAFRDRVKLEIRETGMVRDYFGRIRWFPGAFSPSILQRRAAWREAMNMHIQGPAASIMKMAMARVSQELQERRLDAHLVLTIHDELILEVALGIVDKVAPILYNMSKGLLPIELPIELQIGPNLADLKDYHG